MISEEHQNLFGPSGKDREGSWEEGVSCEKPLIARIEIFFFPEGRDRAVPQIIITIMNYSVHSDPY